MNNEPDYDNLYFEEKKMHTPQVGDVWEFKTKRRYSIIQLVDNDNGCECIVKKGHNIDKEIRIVTKGFIELNCVYLGKSKANIDDLFKTEVENDNKFI